LPREKQFLGRNDPEPRGNPSCQSAAFLCTSLYLPRNDMKFGMIFWTSSKQIGSQTPELSRGNSGSSFGISGLQNGFLLSDPEERDHLMRKDF